MVNFNQRLKRCSAQWKVALALTFFLFALLKVAAQTSSLQFKYGPTNITLEDKLTITFSLEDEELKEFTAFPEIKGFKKEEYKRDRFTRLSKGKEVEVTSVVQFYTPLQKGSYELKDLKIRINGKWEKLPLVVVNVRMPSEVPPNDKDVQGQSQDGETEFEEEAEEGNNGEEVADLSLYRRLNSNKDVFFSLFTDKEKAYVGESIHVYLALFVADNNKTPVEFFRIGQQVQALLKLIKPTNCWEENLGIEEIIERPIKINGRSYSQYLLYRGAFFPLNTQPVVFPSVTLKMAKVDPNDVRNEAIDLMNFSTEKVIVQVRRLPFHPLRDRVPVGVFNLVESTSNSRANTGEGVTYKFTITGKGNFSVIDPPTVLESGRIDVFPPVVTQKMQFRGEDFIGEKTYSYGIVPRVPGRIYLGQSFQWIYFNPKRGRYDTLKPTTMLRVEGVALDQKGFESRFSGFYATMDEVDNSLKGLQRNKRFQFWANIILVVSLVLGLFFIFLKRAVRI